MIRPATSRDRTPSRAVLLGLAVLTLVACGKKGDPMPPILQLPAATKDLAVVQRGDELLVDLGYPKTTAAGTLLSEVTAVTVKRLVTPMPTPVPETPPALPEIDDRQLAGAETVLTLDGEDLKAAVNGDRIAFTVPVPVSEAEAGAGSAVTLAVTTTGPDGHSSAPSNRVTWPRVAPPEPPTEIDAAPETGGVRVRWSHPMIAVVRDQVREEAQARMEAEAAAAEAEEAEVVEETGEVEEANGSETEAAATTETATEDDDEMATFAGFNVYRRRATERGYGPPIRSVGPRSDTLLDTTATYGESYIYAVSAVASRRPVTVESDFVEEVEVDYRDRFAPAAPTGLVALTEGSQVRLVWEESEEADLAGYRLYRRGPDTQEFLPVTEKAVPTNGYTDRGLAPGATYTYRITAIDELGNESKPSETVTAAIR